MPCSDQFSAKQSLEPNGRAGAAFIVCVDTETHARRVTKLWQMGIAQVRP